MSRATLHLGDVRDVLARLPAESIQTCVTSPPYWGLRDYGTPPQVWDVTDPACPHEWADATYTNRGGKGGHGATSQRFGRANVGGQERLTIHADTCLTCGAWRGHLGLEPTPELYVRHLVAVFRAVARVLREDGTLWLNLGDSYAGSGKGGNPEGSPWAGFVGNKQREASAKASKPIVPNGLKSKDLVGIPWRVAFALQADGWYLRSDIIWAKPNPMPESVTDRPTKSHEYLFLLAKSERYYYDQTAILERQVCSQEEAEAKYNKQEHKGQRDPGGMRETTGGFTKATFNPAGRNARTVWTIATQPYSEAHFATFPEELARRCILAGSSAKACETCGAPWERVTEQTTRFEGNSAKAGRTADELNASGKWRNGGEAGNTNLKMCPTVDRQTTGWQPTCACPNTGAASSVVLDPFGGSGTTAAVAVGHGRGAVHIDLNPAYLELARQRIGPMFCDEAPPVAEVSA